MCYVGMLLNRAGRIESRILPEPLLVPTSRLQIPTPITIRNRDLKFFRGLTFISGFSKPMFCTKTGFCAINNPIPSSKLFFFGLRKPEFCINLGFGEKMKVRIVSFQNQDLAINPGFHSKPRDEGKALQK